MSNPWHELFIKLGAMKIDVFAYWFMSNGAEFYFAIPEAEKLKEDTFTDDVEFPFVFSEICSLQIPRSRGKGEFEFRNNLETIATVLPIQGLASVVQPECITISAAE